MWGNLLERGGGLDDGEEERGAGTDAAAAAEKERSVSSSRAKKNKAVAAQKKRSAEWLGEAGNSVLIVWLAVLGITALSYALGLRGDDVGSEGGGVIEKAFKAGPRGAWSIFLTTVVLAPIIEETVFRGFLLPSLTKYMPTWNALAVTTVVFALVHDHNTGDTLQLLCVGAVAGVGVLSDAEPRGERPCARVVQLGRLVLVLRLDEQRLTRVDCSFYCSFLFVFVSLFIIVTHNK